MSHNSQSQTSLRYAKAVRRCETCDGTANAYHPRDGDTMVVGGMALCRDCVDGWVDVPTTEREAHLCTSCHGRGWHPANRGDDQMCVECDGEQFSYTTRPTSWAKIEPGDRVRDTNPAFPGWTATIVSIDTTGDYHNALVQLPGRDGRTWVPIDRLTLICEDKVPPHRLGHPSWRTP